MRACGTGIDFLDFCPRPKSEFSILNERNRALVSERALRVEELRRSPECRAPEPHPANQAALQCQPPPTQETLVLMDASYSMAADFDLPPALVAAMDRNYTAMRAAHTVQERERLGEEIDRIYNQADTPRRPDRIDVARDALRPLLAGIQGTARIKLMTFATCGAPLQQEGAFAAGDQANYDRALDRISLRAKTALAEAIDQLPQQTTAGRSPDRPVNIIILADGEDNCSGDPCAAAARLRQSLPHANVSVVAIGNLATATSCVAKRANGRFLTAESARQLDLRLRQTAGQLDAAECAALGNSAPRPK
ncbi:hypothetical protein PY32053_03286 [Paracoccus yeei]|uniref:VWFA domain-containing protein n=1 Tax=Paracoccus yeei TaxID=147645 RepID=A0A386URT3_9RHOB|nr:vWA domain-containing protein [Paracoccus yeei]AYF02860.1 hypothetical protein PY32053_03286 [Paracoccus yeei]